MPGGTAAVPVTVASGASVLPGAGGAAASTTAAGGSAMAPRAGAVAPGDIAHVPGVFAVAP